MNTATFPLIITLRLPTRPMPKMSESEHSQCVSCIHIITMSKMMLTVEIADTANTRVMKNQFVYALR
jgi:hypothetical protein